MSENSSVYVGQLVRDPVLSATGSGTPKANFTVAHNRRWRNRATGEWDEHVSFVPVVCFGELAENVVASVSQGTRVIVSARLEQRRWETPDTKERREITELVADEVGTSLRRATVEVTKTQPPKRNGSEPDELPNPEEDPF